MPELEEERELAEGRVKKRLKIEREGDSRLQEDSFNMEHGSSLRFDRKQEGSPDDFELLSLRKKRLYREEQKRAMKGGSVGERVRERAKTDSAVPDGSTSEPARALKNTVGVVHESFAQDEDDSASRDVVHSAEKAVRSVTDTPYARKLRRSDNPSGEVPSGGGPEAHEGANTLSKQYQKKEIQRGYQEARTGRGTRSGSSASAAGRKAAMKKKVEKEAEKGSGKVLEKVGQFIKKHPISLVFILFVFLLVVVGSSVFSTCSVLFSGGSGGLSASSFSATDSDILNAEQFYCQLEQQLDEDLEARRVDYLASGLNGTRVISAEIIREPDIGHDPYELAALLSVLYGNFNEADIRDTLLWIFGEQYDQQMSVSTSEREIEQESGAEPESEGESEADESEEEPQTEEVAEVVITVTNRSLRNVIAELNLTDEQLEQYELLVASRGNMEELFSDYEFSDYRVPAEYLSDERFSNIYSEAKRYLNTPYVWGGENPGSGFDCSGFVSYVLNHSGNGLSFQRTDCNGLLSMCTAVSTDDARPGDLVFFQGTQDRLGATHVGIYLGDGMMIHAARPAVRYASLESTYMREHFMTFGRMPE